MIDQGGTDGGGGAIPPREVEPRGLRQPVLATLMASRPMALLATGLLAFQFGMASRGLPAFPCPIATLTPTHCPWCGVSR